MRRSIALGVVLCILTQVAYASPKQQHHSIIDAVSPFSNETYSCDDLGKVPVQLRCDLLRNGCAEDSVIPYAKWYYCHIRSNAFLSSIYLAALVLLLPLLFCMLGDTAEFYFSPIMAHISQSIPKMRPRFAGVTFVALGNGAPDLSANISAISSGNVQLSAGALTGAAMFVQCIVASELLRICNGVKCQGAMLRDVTVYLVSVTGVLIAFALGKISHVFVIGAVTVYVLYVVWVFCGDEWHARGRPKPDLAATMRRIQSNLSKRYRTGVDLVDELEEGLLPWAEAEAPQEGPPAVAEDYQYGRLYAEGGYGGMAAAANGRRPAVHPPLTAEMSVLGSSGRVDSSVLSQVAEDEARDELGTSFATSPHNADDFPAVLRSATAPVAQAPHSLHLTTSVPSCYPGGTGHPRARRSHPHLLVQRTSSQWLDAKTYQRLVWADLTYDEEFDSKLQRARSESLGTYQPPSLPAPSPRHPRPFRGADLIPEDLEAAADMNLAFDAAASEAAAAVDGKVATARVVVGQGPQAAALAAGSQAQHDALTGADGDGASVSPRFGADGRWWEDLRWEVTLGNCEEWDAAGPVRRSFRRGAYPVMMPLYLALRMTVPFLDRAAYSRDWLTVSVLCMPLAVVTYLQMFQVGTVLIAMLVGAGAATTVWVITRHGASPDELEPLALWPGGPSVPLGPVCHALFSLLGFLMGVIWIDTLAGEVVGLVSFAAGLCNFPAATLGLTLLAWGNSLGDFFGNSALARQGQGSTAITACFASPLFNMLISMALGFSAYFARLGVTSVEVHLTPELLLGCSFLIIYNIVIIVVGVLNEYHLPRSFHVFARCWYGLYVALACGAGALQHFKGK